MTFSIAVASVSEILATTSISHDATVTTGEPIDIQSDVSQDTQKSVESNVDESDRKFLQH